MANFCLNPCSNGILKYVKRLILFYYIVRLNPCSNGILKYICCEAARTKRKVS